MRGVVVRRIACLHARMSRAECVMMQGREDAGGLVQYVGVIVAACR